LKSRRILFVVSIVFSIIITLLVCNKKGDAWEEYVRNGLYELTADSIPDYDVDIIDSLGIPYTYYPTQNGISPGNQYNATIICNYALNYFDSWQQHDNAVMRSRFLHCVQWLQQNIERHPDYALFRFYWQQPWYDSVKNPFTSGMTSGLAMQVFTKAHSIIKDSTLVTDASLLLRGFSVPIDSGGFTYKEPTGWWYEELADASKHTPRILDGHLFSLLGLYDYYQITGDPLALQYFNQGAAALKHALQVYDAGNGGICYDKYCKPADKKYRRIITSQLQQLWKITSDSAFLNYFHKWRKPMEKPYAFRAIRDANRSGLILLALLWMICFGVCWLVAYFFQRSFFTRNG
jgi:hypothetical protein